MLIRILDACAMESVTLQASELTIMWPETGIGERVVVPCPCGGLDADDLGRSATRMCNGDFTGPGQFGQGNTAQCNFDPMTLEFCRIAQVSKHNMIVLM